MPTCKNLILHISNLNGDARIKTGFQLNGHLLWWHSHLKKERKKKGVWGVNNAEVPCISACTPKLMLYIYASNIKTLRTIYYLNAQVGHTLQHPTPNFTQPFKYFTHTHIATLHTHCTLNFTLPGLRHVIVLTTSHYTLS